MNSEPSCATPITAATDARLTLDTAATRNPAPMTGVAIGSSTVKSRRSGLYPMAVADARTSGGTEASASATTLTSRATV